MGQTETPRTSSKAARVKLSALATFLSVLLGALVFVQIRHSAPAPAGGNQLKAGRAESGAQEEQPTNSSPVGTMPAMSGDFPDRGWQKNANAHYAEGLGCFRSRQFEKAIPSLEKALADLETTSGRESPDYANCACLLGISYEQSARLDDAERVLQLALLNAEKSHSRKDCVELMYYLGRVTYKQHHYFAARQLLQETADYFEDRQITCETFVTCLRYLSQCYQELGDTRQVKRTNELLAVTLQNDKQRKDPAPAAP